MNFFKGCTTIEEVKKLFRGLARKHHPDLGGDTETMQKLNASYHQMLESLDGQESFDDKGKAHNYKYRHETEQVIMDKIYAVLSVLAKAEIEETVEVVLIGLWVWVRGNTRACKDGLKELGFKWHSKRVCWYWKPYNSGRGYSSPESLGQLADRYGYEKFTTKDGAKKSKSPGRGLAASH